METCIDWFCIDNAEVEQTKAIFLVVFNVKKELSCRPLADALLLSCLEADPDQYYAMVVNQEDQSISWNKVLLCNIDTVGINAKVTTFELLLMFMGSHNSTQYDKRTGDTPNSVLLLDFFVQKETMECDGHNNVALMFSETFKLAYERSRGIRKLGSLTTSHLPKLTVWSVFFLGS